MLIYVVTDRSSRRDLSIESLIDTVAGSGADMVQIREKDLPTADLFRLARRAVAADGPEVFVNGRTDVAICARARGVHLPADGLPARDVRSLCGDRLRIGVSTHGLAEAEAAAASGADFITFGPVFDTPSKRSFGPPQGVAALEKVVATVDVPVFAIGGINVGRSRELAGLPLAGVAMI